MTNDILEQLRALDTPALSDAMDRLGIPGQCLGIMPLDRGFVMAGRAYTVAYEDATEPGQTVGDFIDDLGPGDVCVIDNNGRLDATIWGDIMTILAHRNGVAGTVIDGVCRDVGRALALDYPIFSRSNWMRTGKDRVAYVASNVPVTVGGVTIQPGDYLMGDANGVVAIPADHIEDVLRVAHEIEATEDKIRAAVQAGAALREARAQLGYHSLQTRREA